MYTAGFAIYIWLGVGMHLRRYASPSNLAAALRRYRTGVIAIDGVLGVGKSTLSRRLAKRLGCSVVHLDKHLRKRRGTFFTALRIGQISRAMTQGSSISIIEGVCALQVLEKLNVSPTAIVYVKRMKNGIWRDEEATIPTTSLSQHLEKLRNERNEIAQSLQETPASGPSLTEEVVTYHANYFPQLKATHEYLRTDA